jgi:hypothetical protein
MGKFVIGRYLAAASALSLLLFVSPAAAQSSLPAGLYVRADIGGWLRAERHIQGYRSERCKLRSLRRSFPDFDRQFRISGRRRRIIGLARWFVPTDYLTPAKVNGQSTGAAPSTASADLDSLVGLLNGYFDLAGAFPDRFGRLQPYISAGIGIARNHLGTRQASRLLSDHSRLRAQVTQTSPGRSEPAWDWL